MISEIGLYIICEPRTHLFFSFRVHMHCVACLLVELTPKHSYWFFWMFVAENLRGVNEVHYEVMGVSVMIIEKLFHLFAISPEIIIHECTTTWSCVLENMGTE